uniref:Glycosyl transferase family 29 family protein n=1 Tax=Rhizophora mucronata TaxID=61149 RepID=A0A2P2L0P4_RHIMU
MGWWILHNTATILDKPSKPWTTIFKSKSIARCLIGMKNRSMVYVLGTTNNRYLEYIRVMVTPKSIDLLVLFFSMGCLKRCQNSQQNFQAEWVNCLCHPHNSLQYISSPYSSNIV